MSTPQNRKKLGHRAFMRHYRKTQAYQQSDRAYNVVEYLVRCLRAGWEAGDAMLQLVGVRSIVEFRQKWEQATGVNLDLSSYGVTWFFKHTKPISSFDFSDPKQFLECVSVENLARGKIAKPWRKPRKKPGDESPPLPGIA